MTERFRGAVKAWLPDRGFGFISRRGLPDLFVHWSGLRDGSRADREGLRIGQLVEFSVIERAVKGQTKPQAWDVVVVDEGAGKFLPGEPRTGQPITSEEEAYKARGGGSEVGAKRTPRPREAIKKI